MTEDGDAFDLQEFETALSDSPTTGEKKKPKLEPLEIENESLKKALQRAEYRIKQLLLQPNVPDCFSVKEGCWVIAKSNKTEAGWGKIKRVLQDVNSLSKKVYYEVHFNRGDKRLVELDEIAAVGFRRVDFSSINRRYMYVE